MNKQKFVDHITLYHFGNFNIDEKSWLHAQLMMNPIIHNFNINI